MYLSAVVIVMGQRKSYPTELLDAHCVDTLSSSVDFCYSAANMTSTCRAICDRVDFCWFDRQGPCLVGGEVVVVMMAVLQAISGIGSAFSSIIELTKARVAAAFFLEVIDHKDEMVDKKGKKPASNKGDIVFSDVSFKYKSRDAMILNHLNLTIHENEMVGIVGESGCGKSTILKLLMRLYGPSSGVIEWNGVNVEDLSMAWIRDQISYVAQEPVLFSGTIRKNVLMGVDGEVSDEELKRVCEEALCMDFINEMPDGFETDLGATGKSLSGGQKQRLALARAIVRKPSILLLDEATSALDSENQEKFLEALKRWRSGHPCTVVTVAHRLSTIVDCDVIFVCENGVVVGSGSHEELLKSCESYVELVRGQMSLRVCLKDKVFSHVEWNQEVRFLSQGDRWTANEDECGWFE